MEKTAEQIAAEAAAKKAAEDAKLAKDKAAQEKKEKEAAEKVQASVAAATTAFNSAKEAATAGATAFGSLHAQSTTDEVKAVGDILEANVKIAKDAVKLVKAELRKNKDHGAIQDMATDTDAALAGLVQLQEQIKSGLKAAKDAAKDAEAKAKADEKARKDAEKLAEAERKKAEKEAKKEPEQNGVRKPSAGGLCRAAWDIFDAASTALGSCTPISYVMPASLARGLNEANIKAEYARWKKFHGIEGRVEIPVPAIVTEAINKVEIPQAAK